MKKVGIMSMQRIANYGSFLQAYALKQLIEELGHKVEFVDYHVGAPVIAENADNKNKFVANWKKDWKHFSIRLHFRINCHLSGTSSLLLKSICRFWGLPMK